jgi:hypothetical protein
MLKSIFRTKFRNSLLISHTSEQGGVRWATVSEFGPVLFSRILDLNDTQGGVVSIIFKYCDEQNATSWFKETKKVLTYTLRKGKMKSHQNTEEYPPLLQELFFAK